MERRRGPRPRVPSSRSSSFIGWLDDLTRALVLGREHGEVPKALTECFAALSLYDRPSAALMRLAEERSPSSWVHRLSNSQALYSSVVQPLPTVKPRNVSWLNSTKVKSVAR